ncbi:hypothetical protein PV326_014389 [Microctonus aethiopoides]|nr:hypothetical protein PV326_014389 [Microctonus aethiopoides]
MNTILLDPCGGLSEYSAECSCVNELKAKVFGRRRKEESAISKNTEPKYSPKVLQGNWFEDRIEDSPVSNYSTPPSENKIHSSSVKKDLEENFKTARMIRDKGRGMTRDLLYDHNNKEFQDNFSTVYDLTYRLLPQRSEGSQRRSYNSRINKWEPEQDLTKSFGNVTGYGMTEYIRACQDYANYEDEEKPRTRYECDFSPKKMPADFKRQVLSETSRL